MERFELKDNRGILLVRLVVGVVILFASVKTGLASGNSPEDDNTLTLTQPADKVPGMTGLTASTEWKETCLSPALLSMSQTEPENIRSVPGLTGLEEVGAVEEDDGRFKGLDVSGFARLLFFSRYLKRSYDFSTQGGLTRPYNISIGDGYTQPMIRMRMSGSPFPATSFELELSFHNALLRTSSNNNLADADGRLASPWQILRFEAETYTDVGKFKLIAGGGVNWYKMTPLTLWSTNIGNRRDNLFRKFPWDPNFHEFEKYDNYYNRGSVPRDERWGNAATQGAIVEGTGLPLGLDASLLIGKTSASAGYESYLSERPMNSFGMSVNKNLGPHKVGLNYMDHFGSAGNDVNLDTIVRETGSQADSFFVESNRMSQMVATANGQLNYDFANIYLEAGASSYLSSRYNAGLKDNAKPGLENASRYARNFSEVLFGEAEFNNIPLTLGFFRMGPQFVNIVSGVLNTSVDQAAIEATQTSGSNTNTTARDGLTVMPGQMVSNRKGLFLKGNKSFGPLNVVLEYQISQEVENLYGDTRTGARASEMASNPDSTTMLPYTNSITIQHHLNRLQRSRLGFWARFGGPYNRIENVFRQSYENFAITDTAVDYKKNFSSVRLDLKYKTNLFNKELILINNILYNSVQDNVAPAKFNNDAFIRYFFDQFFAAYAVHPKLTVIGTFGVERTLGNKRVELADEDGELITDSEGKVIPHPDGKPVNQTALSYGYGLDYNFHEDASLHFRHKWYSHDDPNFTKDFYEGQEATLELKVFF